MTRRLDDPQLVREQYASEHSNRRHREEVFDLIACPQSVREFRQHFAAVARRDVVAVATVRDRDTLVAYRRSMLTETQPVPGGVQLPQLVHSRSVVFVAGTAA